MTEHTEQESVRIWEEIISIPTYAPHAPEKNPMFFEKRHNQGASGKVYPYAITEGIAAQSDDRNYTAVFIENEYVQLVILPELGGRIYIGQDKTNGYDFFYRNRVIKPALIGLFGSWLSGGVEFNWPLHHRPSTFMPVDFVIEEEEDGSKTIWLGEHEAFDRNKGMVGICLHPHSSVVEAKVQLYNRTPLPQNFLWWANVGVHVNPQYQIIFPPDVYCVNDHGKRAMASWPIAKGDYGVYHKYDFGEGTDISYYQNFTPAGSCFVNKSGMDFFGGYDHGKDAGVVYVANHHISPGKKFFTWGTTEHAKAWERNLTDEDGPYIELMAGCYTDNQPDFSWIAPYETKTFSQNWYPVQKIGHVKNANLLAAVNLEVSNGKAAIGVCVTSEMKGLRVLLLDGDTALYSSTVDLAPEKPFTAVVNCAVESPTLTVMDDEFEIISYTPVQLEDTTLPEALTEPPQPENVATVEELYLIALHLHQYRQDTRTPESYWAEALRRDPADARSNNALGLLALRRCDLPKAEAHFRAAIARLIRWNLNPNDSEAYYNLGLTLKAQNRLDEAYAAFYKAIWSYAWQSAGYTALAEIDCIRGDLNQALDHLELALNVNRSNSKARNLVAVIFRDSDFLEDAETWLNDTIARDPLDFWAHFELAKIYLERDDEDNAAGMVDAVTQVMGYKAETFIDIAFDYANAGFYDDAAAIMVEGLNFCGPHPMLNYCFGYFLEKMDRKEDALLIYAEAEDCDPDYCFPAQLHEMFVLEAAVAALPYSPKACYYLGNLLYDKRQHEKAMACWQRSVDQDPSFGMVWRNLGMAAFNIERDINKALACYEKALPLDPENARTFFEYDRLLRRKGTPPATRKALYEQHDDLVHARIDLYLENIRLLTLFDDPIKAYDKLLSYRFSPWEGGEGGVALVYEAVLIQQGRKLLAKGKPADALRAFEAGLIYPENLGEGKTALKIDSALYYQIGLAQRTLGDEAAAQTAFEKSASFPAGLHDATYSQALALQALGRADEAEQKLRALLEQAEAEKARDVISGFSHSFSDIFMWQEDPQTAHSVHMNYLIGLAKLGLGDSEAARAAFAEVLAQDANHFATLLIMKTLQ